MRAAVLALFSLYALPAHAAFDVFLSYPGIPGESPAPYAGQIELTSIELDAFRVATVGDTNATGLPKLAEITFTKDTDIASPLFLIASMSSTPHMDDAVISFQRAGASGQAGAYLTITLKHPIVTGFGITAEDGDDVPTESVTLAYETLCLSHRQTNQSGGLESPVTRCWNAATQAEVAP